jgi:hypothetical protein
MREDVIRDIVTRMMMEPEFGQALRESPGKVLGQYNLTLDEIAALQNQAGGIQLDRLEERISASLSRGTRLGANPEPECGCCAVSPKKCPPCP